MHRNISTELNELITTDHYSPAVTIILPFEPKMSLKSELTHSLKLAIDKVEKNLSGNFPADACILVIDKLRELIKSLNFNTQKSSIAIYVSPIFQKVLYLDIPVEERIMVGDSFEIRDLVYAKKQLHKYLVLLLSSRECKIYLGNTTTFVKIVSNPIKSATEYVNEISQRVSNFSDMSERKEILMDKFLHYVDKGLTHVLNAYRLPLFVVGTKKIMGHFKSLTRHEAAVISYIHGNYEDASADELRNVLKPHILDWRSVKTRELVNKLKDAYGRNMLAAGIKNVWHESMHNKGRLLLVEKNYIFPAVRGKQADTIHEVPKSFDKLSFLPDAVDEVIEKVLGSGGDVEFVDEGLLKEYDHIALIQYY